MSALDNNMCSSSCNVRFGIKLLSFVVTFDVVMEMCLLYYSLCGQSFQILISTNVTKCVSVMCILVN